MKDTQQSKTLESCQKLAEELRHASGPLHPDEAQEVGKTIDVLIKREREAEENYDVLFKVAQTNSDDLTEAEAKNAKLRARVEELESIVRAVHSQLAYEDLMRAKGVPDTDDHIRCSLPGNLYGRTVAALSPSEADSEKEAGG